MDNRDLVDYILSGKLKEEDVIKDVIKGSCYDNNESIDYWYNNGFDIYNMDHKLSLLELTDDSYNDLDDEETSHYYEIITCEQANKEQEEAQKREEIERLERELTLLKGK